MEINSLYSLDIVGCLQQRGVSSIFISLLFYCPFITSELGFVFACTKIKVERAMRTDCFFRKKID